MKIALHEASFQSDDPAAVKEFYGNELGAAPGAAKRGTEWPKVPSVDSSATVGDHLRGIA